MYFLLILSLIREAAGKTLSLSLWQERGLLYSQMWKQGDKRTLTFGGYRFNLKSLPQTHPLNTCNPAGGRLKISVYRKA